MSKSYGRHLWTFPIQFEMTKEVLEMFLSHCMNIWQYSTEKKSSDKVRKFVDNKFTMRHILPLHYTHAVIFTLIELYTKLIDEN